MSRYSSDYRRSTGVVDSDSEYYARDHRGRHQSRGPPVFDRPPRREDERWDIRLQQPERYGPPARRSSRHYQDEHLVHQGSLVPYERRRAAESPSPRPRLLRRQSSLDTFDRIPSRKLEEYYHGYLPRAPPSPPPVRRGSFRRSRDFDEYEEIRIAEPDVYGDEEFRRFRERDRQHRSHSRFRERLREELKTEKPYPRKGKTRMPRKLVHTRAIREFGYPFEEEGDLVIIQLALSKEQIDDVIGRSREIKRQAAETLAVHRASRSPVRRESRHRTLERLAMETYSPRSSGTALIIEPSPSRHRSPSRNYREISERKTTRTVSRTRSISVHNPRLRRRSSPVRMLIRNRDDRDDRDDEPRKSSNSPMAIVVRPRERNSDDDLRELRELERLERLRSGEREVIRDTHIVGDGESEEILEVKKDRKGPPSRLLRAMLATMT